MPVSFQSLNASPPAYRSKYDSSSLHSFTLPRSSTLPRRVSFGSSEAVTFQQQSVMVTDRAVPDYDIILVDQREARKYECSVCRSFLRYPVQFQECGHRCCSACLPQLLRLPRCPIDQRKIDKDLVFEDKGLMHELNLVPVRCSNHEKYCQWTGPLKFLKTHMEECGHRQVLCANGCGAAFVRHFLDQHLAEDCPMRQDTCDFCDQEYLHSVEVEHMRTCCKFPLSCPAGCKTRNIQRDQLQHHLDNVCTLSDVACPFVDAGCQHRCRRPKLKMHMRKDFKSHLKLVSGAMRDKVQKFSPVNPVELVDFSKRLLEAESDINDLMIRYDGPMLWKIEAFSFKYKHAKASSLSARITPPNVVSPFFVPRRYGYRLRFTAYLYGNNAAQGICMSLYASLCPAENDPLLDWPFKLKIELTLLDQSKEDGERKHVTSVLDSTEQSHECVKIPDGKPNLEFGVEKFIRLDQLRVPGRYIVDDAIFIRVRILYD